MSQAHSSSLNCALRLLFAACMLPWLGLLPAQAADEPALTWHNPPELPLEQGRAGVYAGVSGGALVIAGGSNFPQANRFEGASKRFFADAWVLPEPGAGQWVQVEGALPGPMAHGISFTWDGALFALGGQNKDGLLDTAVQMRWDGERLESRPLPPLPQPRSHAAAAVLGGTLYLVGGIESRHPLTVSDHCWTLDLTQDPADWHWRGAEGLPGPPRMNPVVAVQDGALFVFSGMRPHRTEDLHGMELLRDAWRFDPLSGWRRVADLPWPAAAAPSPAPALGQSHILLLGGLDERRVPADEAAALRDQHPGFSRDLLAYHAITDTWTPWGHLPESATPAIATPVVEWDGRFIVPMGEVKPRTRTLQMLAAEPIRRTSPLRPLDYATLAGYFLVLVAMGFYFSRREKSTEQYFLGGRKVPWWAAGISMFGTSLSAMTFMAVPALVYRTDWLYLAGSLMVALNAVIVVRYYLPFYCNLNITTAYEYLEKRFGLAVRLFGSVLFVIAQLMRMGVVIYLPALALSAVTGFNLTACILVMGLLATLYTTLGGIEAVIWTDVFQVIILIGGALLSFVLIMAELPGGFGEFMDTGRSAGKFRMVDWGFDLTTTTVFVVVIGNFFKGMIPLTSDQSVIQRYLVTSDQKQAARAMWMNVGTTLPVLFLFFGLGTALWVFYQSHPDLLNPTSRNDEIYPWFIAQQLPAGVSGLVIAALFAAAMSSLDSSMNSIATAITTDFFKRFRHDTDDATFLRIAHRLTLAVGVLGTGSALFFKQLSALSLWDLNIEIIGLFGGALAGIFAAGIFTRRAHGPGMLLGAVASALITYTVKRHTDLNFFMYGVVGILSAVALGWLFSLVLPGPKRDLTDLTLHTRSSRPAGRAN